MVMAGMPAFQQHCLRFAFSWPRLTNQAAHRHLKAGGKGASIINFGSISGLRPESGASAYSAAKGAVHSWTRAAAEAWGADGVRVNAILPAIATPMYHEALARLDDEGMRRTTGATRRRSRWAGSTATPTPTWVR